jgi:hypothetical protein
MAAGAVLRLLEYALDRGYWLDEVSLHQNVSAGLAGGWLRGLTNHQLAPPLCLCLERLMVQCAGDARQVTRALPLAAGLAALPLMNAAAQSILPRFGALLALALFAFSDELIYFSSELKPYALDVAVALFLTAAWQRFEQTPRSAASYAAATVAGAVSLWLSLPSCFVLAALGSASIARRLRGRQWPEAALTAGVAAVWLASFAAMHRVVSALMGHDPAMWTFWDFAFPGPFWGDPFWVPRRVAYLFVNPLDFHGPPHPRVSAVPAIVCAMAGVLWLVRRDLPTAWALLGPGVFALGASACRLYPFHGRCLLFLLPALLIAVAAGAERLTRHAPLWTRCLLSVALLGNMLWRDAQHLAVPRYRDGLNPLGDRRPWRFDPDMFRIPPRPDAPPKR